MKDPAGFPADDRHPVPDLRALPVRVRGIDEPRLLRMLLAESLRRLRSGRDLERVHGVVHPEMTAILRDCERLGRRLNELTRPAAGGGAPPGPAGLPEEEWGGL